MGNKSLIDLVDIAAANPWKVDFVPLSLDGLATLSLGSLLGALSVDHVMISSLQPTHSGQASLHSCSATSTLVLIVSLASSSLTYPLWISRDLSRSI